MKNQPSIPRFPHWFFKWYCRHDRYEEIHGDLEEFFYERATERGLFIAKIYYLFNVIRCFQPYAWKKPKTINNSTITMFNNNFKIAYRSLLRSKAHSAINIIGLAIGIAFSGMLYLYVENELSYDTFHSKSKELYRVVTVDKRNPEKPRYYGIGTPPMGEALKNDYPEVENMTRLFRPYGQVVFKIENQNFQEREWFHSESNFFEIFDFELISGDPKSVLVEPRSIVVTQSAARRYFGNESVIGNLLQTEEDPYVITGVMKDPPQNSHLKFNMLLSIPKSEEGWQQYLNAWDRFGAYTYLQMTRSTSIDGLNFKLDEFKEKYFGPYAETFDIQFQNIEDIYLGSTHIESGSESGHGFISYIYIFSSMGIFILLIACVNYINLATAKAMFRAKEIGVRKVIGANKSNLITQFLTESFLVTFFALVLAFGIMDLSFPYFNKITSTQFDLTIETIGDYLPSLVGLAFMVAIISGSYPAFYLSRLRPIATLKGIDESSKSSSILRKGLVIFQFMLTIVMLVSTLVIGRQLNYIDEKDIGFDKDHLVTIDINNGNVRRQFQTMKNELESIPGVENVGVSSRVPGEWKFLHFTYAQSSSSLTENIDSTRVYHMNFDEGMFRTYGFELLEGSYFSSNSGNDSSKVLINESAVDALGLSEPIGSTIKIRLEDDQQFSTTVIGIVKNFNFQSLHQKIAPLIIGTWNNPMVVIDYFTLRVSGNVSEVLQQANLVHEKFDNRTPMEYNFLDQRLESFYEKEQRAGMIFKMGAGLCIFVACMGLFGLASFTISKRTKELGIRKILGANQSNLFLLLSSSFTKQIMIAFVLASPLAWVIMNNWLEVFEYRISIGVGTFLLSGTIAVLIALITISYRSIKAIRSNPVDSLRYE